MIVPEDGAFPETQIATSKRDLSFFSNLRRMAKQDAHETVDFSAYDDQICKIVDRYVNGEDVTSKGNLLALDDLAMAPPEE